MTGLQKTLVTMSVAGVFAAGWMGSTALQALADKPAGSDGPASNVVKNDADDPFESNAAVPPNPQIDYDGFVEMAASERDERAKRRVPLEKFLEMSGEPNTIILDTRSKAAFDAAHLKGAVHLNFSDFTTPKLASVIPDKNTRVLIYCNNNFVSVPVSNPANAGRSATESELAELANSGFVTPEPDEPKIEEMRFVSKMAPLALNIPTFINLRGYGYANVYELADAIAVNDPRVTFEGAAVERTMQQIASLSVNGQ